MIRRDKKTGLKRGGMIKRDKIGLESKVLIINNLTYYYYRTSADFIIFSLLSKDFLTSQLFHKAARRPSIDRAGRLWTGPGGGKVVIIRSVGEGGRLSPSPLPAPQPNKQRAGAQSIDAAADTIDTFHHLAANLT